MTENEAYWPTGFFEELLAIYEADSVDQCLSAKLGEMYRRAAEESAASVIADPRDALREQAGDRAKPI